MNEMQSQPEARALVAKLASKSESDRALARLLELGPAASAAVLEGLCDGRWQVRRGCIGWLTRCGDAAARDSLVPLLRDPRVKVRVFAILALAYESSAVAAPSAEVTPLLIERILLDESLRVRRYATMMLAFGHAHPDLEGFFQQLLDTETDAKLHRGAGMGLLLCRQKVRETC